MRRSGISIMAKLIGLVKPLIAVMIAAIIMGVVGFLCAIFIPILGGYGILKGIAGIDAIHISISTIIGLMVLCAVLRGVLYYIEQACNHYIAFKLLAIIRHKVFAVLRRLAPAKLEGKNKGNLISVITSDIELLEVFYAHTISPIIIAILTCIIMIGFIGSYHAVLGVIACMGYFVVGYVIPMITSKMGKEDGMKYRNEFGELNGFFLDNLRGLSESIQYNITEKRLQEMNKRTDVLNEQQRKLKDYEARTKAMTGVVVLLIDLAVFFTSIYFYEKGMLGIDGVVIATIAMMSSFGPVIALSNLSNNLLLTLASGERVLSILEETPQVEDVTDGKDISFDGATMKDVSFSYENELVLDQVSFDIKKNSIVGIRGKSGSGKSTVLKLLMRFWDTKDGSVEISNTPIKEINTNCLRNIEGYMTQETCMFHDTIAANIRIGKLDATMEEVIEKEKKASIHEFIESLPNGYETKVSELGDSLSGGEKQRIGIARAFLHDAPFLLLDEPTSNLDSLNEGIILKSLCEECEDKTVILVSHRESTMRVADYVYEMNCGRIS